ncbi:hypothetical protein [Streptomyces sp. GC420]|uniref:hypothetical protein n=1 Tax=Streptomyces sp. GC420 TaxID=2697568 RepID=UPI001414F636|nr:hypothetical protein [Streptomyces sp. GC420]NBM17170.1 hypothetical protein [Streptomyces sp. GC420]
MNRMNRMKKYAVAVTVTAALVGTATASAHAVGTAGAPSARTAEAAEAAGAAQVAQAAAPAHSPVRVVAPGEVVRPAAGIRLWLTEEGKHWFTYDQENFRSVVDGNLDLSVPGASFQLESYDDRPGFASGVYYGPKPVGRVEYTNAHGATVAQLVKLPGKRDWGAWYAVVPAGELGEQTIVLYDKAGNVLEKRTIPTP